MKFIINVVTKWSPNNKINVHVKGSVVIILTSGMLILIVLYHEEILTWLMY